MAKGKRTRRPIVLDATAIVPARRHGVIGMTPASASRRTRVSLCVIARDEAEHLGPCLQSTAGAVDEIVVVDTGSSDDTIEVARAHGANVLQATDGRLALPATSRRPGERTWVLTSTPTSGCARGRRAPPPPSGGRPGCGAHR
jgi:hypothetical protein